MGNNKNQGSIPHEKNTESHDERIDPHTAGKIATKLTLEETARISITSHQNYLIFQPFLAQPPLAAVVQASPDKLENLVKKYSPNILFAKGEITDPLNQVVYHNVSAYQLMTFLCDDDMQDKIVPLIPEDMIDKCHEQDSEMDCGGCDLIKMVEDPEQVILNGFKALTEFRTTYTITVAQQSGDSSILQNATLPLLENPDGIIYYHDNQGQAHFYYANRQTETLQKITPQPETQDDKKALEAFSKSMAAMENNSGRRSSDEEHALIKKTMGYQLIRKGVHYTRNNISYHDSQNEFRLLNAYRTCLRLYDDAQNEEQRNAADEYWREKVGKAQGEVMWLLQRLCQDRQTYVPPNPPLGGFTRGLSGSDRIVIYDIKPTSCFGKSFMLVQNGQPHRDLGSKYALCTSKDLFSSSVFSKTSYQVPLTTKYRKTTIERDLVYTARLVEQAKNAQALKVEKKLQIESINSRHG
ncbi:hypothetical protein [Legionella spiritensis]|uniref:Uncharacterized protein n=1 Tax=Legionella spiritensis TaxID=452 RepID=A0A0W0Z6Z9_LEGSP|nr:hypothetical protein [Legionella spiritensis]KTD64875.1 hypothetical protein Lspi_1042 [Legionella spiritensis]SNV41048.1 Uncharacterised protein [Legionella spiritensis]